MRATQGDPGQNLHIPEGTVGSGKEESMIHSKTDTTPDHRLASWGVRGGDTLQTPGLTS